jgi:uncharacterized membrane protein YphA (DoxX/SURF4 family)
MWAIWIFIVFGGILAVGLGIGLAMAFAAPFFAVPLALFIFLAVAAVRRANNAVSGDDSEGAEADPAETRRRNRPERPDAGKAEPSH